MNFKQFLNEELLIEFREEIAHVTALGGENKVIADLKAFGVKNLRTYPDKINDMKEKKRIYFDRLEAEVDNWHTLFEYLKSKNYQVYKTYVPGVSIGHYALKTGGFVFEFFANKNPVTRKPYIKVYVVKKIEPITPDEEKRLIQKTSY